ncbi:outer membrane lipoprotein-sorting protein [Aliiglaciecola sp. LCG003]|uniref:outer membrane lipoprotein-sorting protein n=1 Tax=Aliiglaciecola sp. LCG003 TaxID=3053655 RepID=UPI00257310F4|nr:outer membrane lipoprotein-sorting protein [Aliiglaciecola sp. LCG003]WJG10791.1 outer membrane lipoprotein-sorting protein [Aliiglaciecola sp. LCG003]
MKFSITTPVAALMFGAAMCAPVLAQSDVNDIIIRAEKASYYAGDDGKSDARMMIVDNQGRKQVRQFTILRKDLQDNGDQQMMVFFTRPTDVKDTVFRVEKHANSGIDDDRWLYLPALDLVKRISAGDKRTSFVGSHFFYEDVSGRAVAEDTFSLVSEEGPNFVLKAEPKVPASVEFSHYVVEIDKSNYLPVKIDFYKGEKLYRQVEAVTIETVDGYPTVLRSKVTDLENNGYTLMEFRNIKYNINLPDDVFSERSLRTPPRAWLE